MGPSALVLLKALPQWSSVGGRGDFRRAWWSSTLDELAAMELGFGGRRDPTAEFTGAGGNGPQSSSVGGRGDELLQLGHHTDRQAAMELGPSGRGDLAGTACQDPTLSSPQWSSALVAEVTARKFCTG